MAYFLKAPAARLDFEFDWSKSIAPYGDTITNHVLSWFDQGDQQLLLDGDVLDGTATKVKLWLQGGTLGATYKIQCYIETAQGRSDVRTMIVKIVNR